MLKNYVKKPITIQAIQWNGNYNDLKGIFPIENAIEPTEIKRNGKIVISTLEGKMTGNHGDYLIIGIKGEVYPCKKEIFEESYEEVN